MLLPRPIKILMCERVFNIIVMALIKRKGYFNSD